MKNYIIYRFTNTVNGKCYVGLTTQTLKKRVYLHYWVAKKHAKSHFHKALMKYPKEHWVIESLEEGTATIETIKEREKHFISENQSYPHGYNSTAGGDNFLSSDYQRELQKFRVRNGTHPFVGGHIQSETMKRRHANGEFKDLNKQRVENKTHNFLGDNNPAKKLGKLGQHHNQKDPWDNTKVKSSPDAMKSWEIADQIFDWYDARKDRPRKCGYTLAARHFNLNCSLYIMIDKFKSGWIPTEDTKWVARFK